MLAHIRNARRFGVAFGPGGEIVAASNDTAYRFA
jgi:hypothetical protein